MKTIKPITYLFVYFVISSAMAQSPVSASKNQFVERNIFHLKYGASREALPMWREYLQRVQQRDPKVHVRLLTDISGPAYSLVLEIEYETFAEMEPSECRLTNQPDWKEFYQKFIPLCERSERTYFKKQVEF
jgi:hypothetical protein